MDDDLHELDNDFEIIKTSKGIKLITKQKSTSRLSNQSRRVHLSASKKRKIKNNLNGSCINEKELNCI